MWFCQTLEDLSRKRNRHITLTSGFFWHWIWKGLGNGRLKFKNLPTKFLFLWPFWQDSAFWILLIIVCPRPLDKFNALVIFGYANNMTCDCCRSTTRLSKHHTEWETRESKQKNLPLCKRCTASGIAKDGKHTLTFDKGRFGDQV